MAPFSFGNRREKIFFFRNDFEISLLEKNSQFLGNSPFQAQVCVVRLSNLAPITALLRHRVQPLFACSNENPRERSEETPPTLRYHFPRLLHRECRRGNVPQVSDSFRFILRVP